MEGNFSKVDQYLINNLWWFNRKTVDKFRDDLPIYTIRISSCKLRYSFGSAVMKEVGIKDVLLLLDATILTVDGLDPIQLKGAENGLGWRFTFQIIFPEP